MGYGGGGRYRYRWRPKRLKPSKASAASLALGPSFDPSKLGLGVLTTRSSTRCIGGGSNLSCCWCSMACWAVASRRACNASWRSRAACCFCNFASCSSLLGRPIFLFPGIVICFSLKPFFGPGFCLIRGMPLSINFLKLMSL